MRPGIGPFNAVKINMTGNAIRIAAFGIMTGHTLLNIPFCQRRMRSAAAAHTDSGESGSFVTGRHNAAECNAAVHMTIAAEFLAAMAGLAIGCLSF